VQILIEAIHNETYSVLIDTYVSNEEEKNKLFNAIETIPAVKRKAEWAKKWIEMGSSLVEGIPSEYMETFKEMYKKQELKNNEKQALEFLVKPRPSFAQRLLAFVCVEGLFFSGSFCAIYWLKSRGLMGGLCTSNDFISRDENIHTEFAIELYKMLDNKLTTEKVHELFNEAVEIETEFITESLPVSLLGMNCNLMTQYIKYVADRWLVLLDYPKLYNAENPFTFMELISMTSKTNFFEHKETNYQRPSVNSTEKERTLEFDDFDF
jgi:ribonucleoside-diphosphate reductase beta chain